MKEELRRSIADKLTRLTRIATRVEVNVMPRDLEELVSECAEAVRVDANCQELSALLQALDQYAAAEDPANNHSQGWREQCRLRVMACHTEYRRSQV